MYLKLKLKQGCCVYLLFGVCMFSCLRWLYPSLLPQTKNIRLRLIGHSKLTTVLPGHPTHWVFTSCYITNTSVLLTHCGMFTYIAASFFQDATRNVFPRTWSSCTNTWHMITCFSTVASQQGRTALIRAFVVLLGSWANWGPTHDSFFPQPKLRLVLNWHKLNSIHTQARWQLRDQMLFFKCLTMFSFQYFYSCVLSLCGLV